MIMSAEQIREYLLKKLEIIAHNRDNADANGNKKQKQIYEAQFDIVEDILCSIR